MQSRLRSATATHPVSPNQSARSSNIAENTQRSSPEMRRNNQMPKQETKTTKKQESQQRSPPAPKIQSCLSTSPHPYYANGSSQSNPRTSAQYSNENSSHIPIEIAAPAKQEDKTDQTKRKTRKRSLSMSTIDQNLNFVGEPQETRKKRKIEDIVIYGEAFLQILQDNIEKLRLSSFQLQTIQKVIDAAKEIKHQAEQN